jgi:ankyrin repeat protein
MLHFKPLQIEDIYTYLVERLLKVGMDPNSGVNGRPPLVLAARSGHSDVVELLLDAVNIDPNVRAPFGLPPLY